MNTYGVNTKTCGYVDVSKTLLGAKQYATRNGYTEVYMRFNGSFNIAMEAYKNIITNKWVNTNA